MLNKATRNENSPCSKNNAITDAFSTVECVFDKHFLRLHRISLIEKYRTSYRFHRSPASLFKHGTGEKATNFDHLISCFGCARENARINAIVEEMQNIKNIADSRDLMHHVSILKHAYRHLNLLQISRKRLHFEWGKKLFYTSSYNSQADAIRR